MAVVYAVMLELGFDQTTYGKAILAACFINDLGTVLALGLIFSTVIGSAVIPTAIANARFMPRHLLPEQESALKESAYGEPVGDLES